jgi:hypothetical protein
MCGGSLVPAAKVPGRAKQGSASPWVLRITKSRARCTDTPTYYGIGLRPKVARRLAPRRPCISLCMTRGHRVRRVARWMAPYTDEYLSIALES